VKKLLLIMLVLLVFITACAQTEIFSETEITTSSVPETETSVWDEIVLSSLGELSIWRDADSTIIGRWGPHATDIPTTIYIQNAGNNNLDLLDAMTFAVNAWNEALSIPGHMSVEEFQGDSPPAGARIWFVGGTAEQLVAVRRTLLPCFTEVFLTGTDRPDSSGNPRPRAGAACQQHRRREGHWIYINNYGQNVRITGRILIRKYGFIRARDQGNLTSEQLQNLYRNVAIHELAHALGWWIHSGQTVDIMYRNNINNTWPNARQTLTVPEINHLRQVYGLAPLIE